MTITKHCQNERAARYAFIATTIGLGKVIHTAKSKSDDTAIISITDTGVLIVSALDGTIITMYIATLRQIACYYPNGVVPMVLSAIVKTNMKRGYCMRQDRGEV